MKRMTLQSLAVACALAAASMNALPAARAAEPPLELRWDNLVPPAPAKPPKPFFQPKSGPYEIGSDPSGEPPPPPKPEGKWMAEKSRTASVPPEVVASLDGKRVHIGGYVVPLDFDATRVKEFLLVPFVGACIHVPPPPANQIIYVKAEKGFDVKGSFDPVYVTGTLRTEPASTGLADTGYSLDAEMVEDRAK